MSSVSSNPKLTFACTLLLTVAVAAKPYQQQEPTTPKSGTYFSNDNILQQQEPVAELAFTSGQVAMASNDQARGGYKNSAARRHLQNNSTILTASSSTKTFVGGNRRGLSSESDVDSDLDNKAAYYEDHSQLAARLTMITIGFCVFALLGLLIYYCRMRNKTMVLSKAISQRAAYGSMNESKMLPLVQFDLNSPEKIHPKMVGAGSGDPFNNSLHPEGPTEVTGLAGSILTLSKMKKPSANRFQIDDPRADTALGNDPKIRQMMNARKNFPATGENTPAAPTQIGPMSHRETDAFGRSVRIESFEDETIPGDCTKQKPYQPITPGGQRRPTVKAEQKSRNDEEEGLVPDPYNNAFSKSGKFQIITQSINEQDTPSRSRSNFLYGPPFMNGNVPLTTENQQKRYTIAEGKDADAENKKKQSMQVNNFLATPAAPGDNGEVQSSVRMNSSMGAGQFESIDGESPPLTPFHGEAAKNYLKTTPKPSMFNPAPAIEDQSLDATPIKFQEFTPKKPVQMQLEDVDEIQNYKSQP